MACGWFIAELDLSGCRVPIAAEFHKWAPRARRQDRIGIDDQNEGQWEAGEHPTTRARSYHTSQARTLVLVQSVLTLSSSGRLRSGCGVALEQIGERGEGSIWLTARQRFIRSVTDLIALMLIVVTVEAEQLPVAAVRGIVVMVVVLMMDRELVQLLSIKLSSTMGTDPGE